MDAMKTTLQDALDKLVSARSSTEAKGNALNTLERVLALACVPTEKPDEFYTFLALQDTFECNVPSRLLAWVASSTSKLEILTNKGSMDHEREVEASALSAQLCLSLSIIQGVALHHSATKSYLGRSYALKVLLELLLASRHLSSIQLKTPNSTSSPGVPLSSVVLDTVLCILVDSSPALRVFEESDGVQAVVKILKRAGTPREVRMKCLEFLYFYLLDETSPTTMAISQEPTPPPTAPTTPYRTRTRALARSSTSASHSRCSSDFSLSSMSSFSSSFSSTSSSTHITSTSSDSASPTSTTPPRTPPLPTKQAHPLFMLRKEVDFIPQSPKKPPTTSAVPNIPKSPTKHLDSPRTPKKVLGVGVGGRVRSMPRSRLGSGGEDENSGVGVTQEDGQDDSEKMAGNGRGGIEYDECVGEKRQTRTTDEKRRILGSMLGNVDALVEGVRKAGVWGFG